MSKVCPFCAEEVLPAAVKCKHCGSSLEGGASRKDPPPRAVYLANPNRKINAKIGIYVGAAVLILIFIGIPLIDTIAGLLRR